MINLIDRLDASEMTLGLLVELGVANGNGRLARESGEKFNFLAGKLVLFFSVEVEDPQRFIPDDERQRGVGNQAVALIEGSVISGWIGGKIAHGDRRLGFQDAPGPSPRADDKFFLPLLGIDVAAREQLELAAVFV